MPTDTDWRTAVTELREARGVAEFDEASARIGELLATPPGRSAAHVVRAVAKPARCQCAECEVERAFSLIATGIASTIALLVLGRPLVEAAVFGCAVMAVVLYAPAVWRLGHDD